MTTQDQRNKIVLGTLITWIAQSSVGVLSPREAAELLKMLEGEARQKGPSHD